MRARFDHDFGRVSGPEAANYLIELATRAEKAIAVNAILAAVTTAGQPALYRDLVRIAADESRPDGVRGTALHWAALDPTPGAAQLIRENAARMPREVVPREEAFRRSAIGESNAYMVPQGEFAAKSAIAVAIDDRQPLETRKKMIAWLHEQEPAFVAPLYDLITQPSFKLYLVEYLAKIDNEKVARKLIEIARTDPDADIRRAAAVSLRAHTNAAARGYR